MGETIKVRRFTNKQLEEIIEKEFDKLYICQELATKYDPLLGVDLEASLNMIKMTVGILSRQTN